MATSRQKRARKSRSKPADDVHKVDDLVRNILVSDEVSDFTELSLALFGAKEFLLMAPPEQISNSFKALLHELPDVPTLTQINALIDAEKDHIVSDMGKCLLRAARNIATRLEGISNESPNV